jgi:septal ring factor EnvC (AmiA/AmiB activator)
MNRIKNSIVLALPLLAVACATAPKDCDPTRADFFKNTGCLASGAYDERQARLEDELAREQERNRAFREVLGALEEEKAGVEAGLRASQSRYAKLDAAWRSLRGDLLRSSAQSAELERQIGSLDAQMARRKASGSADVKKRIQERDDLRRRLSLLQQEIDAGVYE